MPAAQPTQAIAPVADEYCPARHGLHLTVGSLAALGEYMPGSQLAHPVPSVNVAVMYFPAAQLYCEHDVKPALAANWPAAQFMHVSTFGASSRLEYFPAGQLMQSTPPVADEYFPLGHEVHEVCREASWNLPTGQAEHAETPNEDEY